MTVETSANEMGGSHYKLQGPFFPKGGPGPDNFCISQ